MDITTREIIVYIIYAGWLVGSLFI